MQAAGLVQGMKDESTIIFGERFVTYDACELLRSDNGQHEVVNVRVEKDVVS